MFEASWLAPVIAALVCGVLAFGISLLITHINDKKD